MSPRKLTTAASLTLLCLFGVAPSPSLASDHNESIEVQQDATADLTDLYVFACDGDKRTSAAPVGKDLCVIINWAGFNFSRPQPDAAGAYSKNYLYALNIDSNGDNVPDNIVYWKFGQNAAGEWGVQVSGLPGSEGTISGAVETRLSGGNDTLAYAGHGAETFRLDAQGFLDTLATGTISFNNKRSLLNGLNVTYMALKFPTSAVYNGKDNLAFWITSARK